MSLTEKDHHWTPQAMHGVIPMPEDGNIEAAVNKAIRKLVLQSFRRSPSSLNFIVHTNPDGSQSIVFEVRDDD